MAGTNLTRGMVPTDIALAPAVILVRPQLGENIGMCARAMLNCGVTELRIVAPRDGWPNPDAVAAASGAIDLLERAIVFKTTAEAVADLELVLATTARPRGMIKEIYTPDEAARRMREKNSDGVQRCGILFGPERTGLENDDVAMANAILNIPLNPAFSSLNLAQAVLLVSHAWLSADNPFKISDATTFYGVTEPARKEDIENLMTYLESMLEKGDFFRSPEQRPTLIRNIRNFFFRSPMTAQDARTLFGVFKSLAGMRGRKDG
jgi:tRNA/rRNA methyltransferase